MQYLTSIIRDVTNWDHLPHFPSPCLPPDHLSSFPLSYSLPSPPPPPRVCPMLLFRHLWRNFKQSMGARNRVEIGLSYRQATRLAESIHWNRFLGSLKVQKFVLCLPSYMAFKFFAHSFVYVQIVIHLPFIHNHFWFLILPLCSLKSALSCFSAVIRYPCHDLMFLRLFCHIRWNFQLLLRFLHLHRNYPDSSPFPSYQPYFFCFSSDATISIFLLFSSSSSYSFIFVVNLRQLLLFLQIHRVPFASPIASCVCSSCISYGFNSQNFNPPPSAPSVIFF